MKTKTFKIVVSDEQENDPDECLENLDGSSAWKDEIKEALDDHSINLIKIEEVPNETT